MIFHRYSSPATHSRCGTLSVMGLKTTLLEQTLVYRAWQAPFVEQKLTPVFANNDLSRIRRVLDVGCGPGTNTAHFVGADYLGVDINERYIKFARQRHGRNFLVTDVRDFRPDPKDRFDFILANSFLHHLDTEDVIGILSHLQSLLTEDGHIHILELVLPEEKSFARVLALWDRGRFVRPLRDWRHIFTVLFDEVIFQPYTLTAAGATLWKMVYFKGRALR
jgi:SAM-dependent methyltransferase